MLFSGRAYGDMACTMCTQHSVLALLANSLAISHALWVIGHQLVVEPENCAGAR